MADWQISPAQLVAVHLERNANTTRGYAQDLDAMTVWMKAKDRTAAAEELIESGRAMCKVRLMEWVNQMRGENLAANTIRRRVAAVTSMISLAQDLGIIGWQVGRLKSLPPPSRVRECKGPSRSIVEEMFKLCRLRGDAKGLRDVAILSLLYLHALRASEVLSPRLRDVDLRSGTIRIIAKRGQGRLAMELCMEAREALVAWVNVRGADAGPLFTKCRRGGHLLAEALDYEGLRFTVKMIGLACGAKCWPHALRHAAISHLAAYSHDSSVIGCALSRHRDIRAWAGYQDSVVSHVAAAELLSAGRMIR
jgi:integrase/recombinase XerD